MQKSVNHFSLAEEILHAVTHGIRFLLSIAGLVLLIVAASAGGVIFYVKDNITYFHTIWHLFVIAGSALHFFAILLYVLPANA